MTHNQHSMQDPTTQYPQLAPPEQHQKEPGLDSELKPLADHGTDTYQGSKRLEGRKAFITGGDSGIGRAVAIAFAREGADVAFTYLESEKSDADQTVESISVTGKQVFAIETDFTDETRCRDAVNQAVSNLGGIDIVVNNAGKQVYNDDITTIPSKQIVETFTVNIIAMFWVVQEALRHLPKGATIINTTSIQAYQPSAGLIDYAATKAAIMNFTKGLSEQLAPKGIRVNAVAPGPIWTPLQPSYGQPQEKLQKFGQDTPLGRAGQPAELAPAYVFLASQESSFVTGAILPVTGGEITA